MLQSIRSKTHTLIRMKLKSNVFVACVTITHTQRRVSDTKRVLFWTSGRLTLDQIKPKYPCSGHERRASADYRRHMTSPLNPVHTDTSGFIQSRHQSSHTESLLAVSCQSKGCGLRAHCCYLYIILFPLLYECVHTTCFMLFEK